LTLPSRMRSRWAPPWARNNRRRTCECSSTQPATPSVSVETTTDQECVKELPSIYHRKEYEADLDRFPDYRLTCFFVDRKYRRKGVAAVALRGALGLIAQAGGGVVEAYLQDTLGKKVSASFLYNVHPHIKHRRTNGLVRASQS
jgi:GNAT superfamily N-acetyltransferase